MIDEDMAKRYSRELEQQLLYGTPLSEEVKQWHDSLVRWWREEEAQDRILHRHGKD